MRSSSSSARLLALLLLTALIVGTCPPRPARADDNLPGRCFAATGQCVGGAFLAYREAHGGLAQQGLPLTGEFAERNPADGKTYSVQYFERARFEHHPEHAAPDDVLLGRLGDEQYRARYPGGRPSGGAGDSCFPETGRCVRGAFAAYWVAHGGLARQGLPLSDEFDEASPTGGRVYRVQYFERARFEYHPEHVAPDDVLLGLLGREQLAARYLAGSPPAAEEAALLALIAAQPGQRCPALRPDPILARVAHERAADMAARRYFAHVNPDGLGPNALVRRAGYPLPVGYGTAPGDNSIESIVAGRAYARGGAGGVARLPPAPRPCARARRLLRRAGRRRDRPCTRPERSLRRLLGAHHRASRPVSRPWPPEDRTAGGGGQP